MALLPLRGKPSTPSIAVQGFVYICATYLPHANEVDAFLLRTKFNVHIEQRQRSKKNIRRRVRIRSLQIHLKI